MTSLLLVSQIPGSRLDSRCGVAGPNVFFSFSSAATDAYDNATGLRYFLLMVVVYSSATPPQLDRAKLFLRKGEELPG